MAERFKYEKRYYYPHMMPNDVAIWERFIVAHPDYFDECEYDVPVGSGPDFDTTVNEPTGGDALKLYRRKIDVVGYKDGRLFIVEIKPRAGTSAIGQVRGYALLYKQEYNPPSDPTCMIVTDILRPDMNMLAAADGVKLMVV